ncbi:MAG: hypothetical protein AAB309_01290 [Deltaproteobacteria bacterium]
MYEWGYYRPYVSVAEKRKKAVKAVAKLLKKGKKVSPIKIQGRMIAKTFWGKAWCDHLESFSDYENRLPRGRTYVRNGAVIHLQMEKGKVEALVQGSSLYKVKIDIKCVDDKKWKGILGHCSGEIDSVVELLQGKLSTSVMKIITDKQNGLFPLPKEISLNCSCSDWAEMCKHVAAVLYGVGARLDEEPELLFKLRHVYHLELISKATLKAFPTQRGGKAKVIKGQNLSDLFGIEVEADASPETPKQIEMCRPKIANKMSTRKRNER